MHEFFGELDIDESADSAFAFYDKLSSSEIVWSTPTNSISFVIFDRNSTVSVSAILNLS